METNVFGPFSFGIFADPGERFFGSAADAVQGAVLGRSGGYRVTPDCVSEVSEDGSLRDASASLGESCLPVSDLVAGMMEFHRPRGTSRFRATLFAALEGLANEQVDLVGEEPGGVDDVDIDQEFLVVMKDFVFGQVVVRFINKIGDVGAVTRDVAKVGAS
jgi:hypothetical protein